MHITDLLNLQVSDFAKERNRIATLLNEQEGSDFGGWISLKEMIESRLDNCKIRGSAITVDDLFDTYSGHWKKNTLEGLLLYFEIVLNLLHVLPNLSGGLEQNQNQIIGNIKYLLEKTGYKVITATEDVYVIIPKDELANAAIEDLSDKSIALAILEYGRIDKQGDLKHKREALVKIARFLEPRLQDRGLQGFEVELADNINFGLNNFNVRHNNEEGKSENLLLKNLKPQMLETVYDDLYRSLLLFFEIEKNEPGSKRFAKLRQLLKKRQAEAKRGEKCMADGAAMDRTLMGEAGMSDGTAINKARMGGAGMADGTVMDRTRI